MTTYSEYSNIIFAQSWEAETATLITASRYTLVPSVALCALINKTIKDLKDNGIFSKLKKLYCRRTHELPFSLQNWVANNSNGTAYNTPTFRPGYGVKGNANNMYIKNGFNANVCSENSLCVFVWLTTQPSSFAKFLNGAITGSSNRLNIDINSSPANTARITTGGSLATSKGIGTGNEILISCDRTDISTAHVWLNGGSKTTVSTTNNGALPTTEVGSLCYLSSGTPAAGTYTDAEIGWEGWSDPLTDGEQLTLYNILKYFNDNIVATL